MGAKVTFTVTAEQVGTLLAIKDEADRKFVYDTAVEYVTDAFSQAFRAVPGRVADDCLVKVAQAVKDGRRRPGGGQQVATTDGPPVQRAPRDPLQVIEPILARYVVRL